MGKTSQLLGFLYKNCYDSGYLSMLRLEKLAYLCDWFSSVYNRRPITDIEWTIAPSGIKAISELPEISQKTDLLTEADMRMALRVIDGFRLKDAGIDRLKPLANSTYPNFLQPPLGEPLDLVKIADLYREVRNNRAWSDKTVRDQESSSAD